MVLESFLTPSDARRNSWSLFFVGLIYTSIAILLSLIVFPGQASIFSIFLTTLATSPLFFLLMKDEESITINFENQSIPVFRNHLNIISVFFFLFLGYTVAFSLWFSFLPDNMLTTVFSEQMTEINTIRSSITGNLTFNEGLFMIIAQNNLRVLFFVLLFSFVYGAGAVIILCWNASVLGTTVGLFIRDKMTQTPNDIAIYLASLPYGLGQYMFHGVFEIIAYFMISLAGGILSAAIVRKRYKSSNFLKLIKNTTVLVAGAILLILIAAFIEVSI
ncbi:MAG: stage II sporulation protein M [Nanoarchaeota archaeon]|nr:stage II sporulation protein M [Nanoarchaeota archaeon]